MGPGKGQLFTAVLITAAGLGISIALFFTTGTGLTVGVMLLAVMFAAYFCGRDTALVAAGIYATASLTVIPHDPTRMALFVVNSAVISTLIGRLLVAMEERKTFDARFEQMFHASPLPTIIIRETDKRIVDVNDAFLSAFGWKRDEIIGEPALLVNLYPVPLERARLLAAWRAEARVRNFELVGMRKTGERRTLLVSVDRVLIGGVPHAQTQINDITERKRAEAALRESDERFHAITENIEEVFWMCQSDGRTLYVSPAFERVWGRPADAIYDEPNLWFESIHPDDRPRILEAISKRLFERRDYLLEYRIRRPDGTERWIRDRGSPVRDSDGNVIRVVGIAEDITARRALEDQLRQAQKMESLGLLAGGVAHDFNNLLAVIASCNSMLAEDLGKGTEQRELVDEIEGAVNRASALTRQLLAFSRRQVTEPRVIDLNQVVNETRKMLRRMVGEDIVLTTSLEPELGHVRADPGYVVQVLMNLAVNARDAMPRGGALSITTRNAVLASGGAAVLISVADTGAGMTEAVKERIFEPFFTTKGQGHGTGMGLAVVHGIVDQAGGFIEVESTPNFGTTFQIYLPAVDATIDRLDDIAGAMAFGVEQVLIVDDDVYVRRVAARALRTRGYQVLEASDGPAALALLESRGHVDLLLTDVVMPGLDGRQLAELACAKQPDLKVLYTSGYTDDAVVRHGVLRGAVELIEKPFRIDSLAMKVRQILDKDPAVSAA